MHKKWGYKNLFDGLLPAFAVAVTLGSCSQHNELVRVGHDAAACAGLPENQAAALGKNLSFVTDEVPVELRFPKGRLVQIDPSKRYPNDCLRIVDYTPFSVEDLHISSTPYHAAALGQEMVEIPGRANMRTFVVSVTD
jgi:hypothetical protein